MNTRTIIVALLGLSSVLVFSGCNANQGPVPNISFQFEDNGQANFFFGEDGRNAAVSAEPS